MRRQAKFLTVVWGEAYIERFATLALPSFLAPGNLPALAAATDLEVVVMTARRDIATFEKHASFARLREVCPVRFVDIDDLIVGGLYGVTLTLAYARAVIACGKDMLRTHFVFMNADFVLADGSLRELARHVEAGRSIVLAPSFRATAEVLEPRLRAAVDPKALHLAIPARQLVAMSLANPHPTTTAKIVSQHQRHSVNPNQFFWQVDERTMLGRYFLIFMLCLRPERLFSSVNSFCDYCFIPEMCPSGDEIVLGDSDEFFMLELQDEDQEMGLLGPGSLSRAATVTALSEWTTAEHRRAARFDVLFHAGDIPSVAAAVRSRAAEFVGDLTASLGPPILHGRHPHWEDALLDYEDLLRMRGLRMPKEIRLDLAARIADRARLILRRTVRWWFRRLMGLPPQVTFLHPDWSDFAHLKKAIAKVRAEAGERVLLVRDPLDLPMRAIEGDVDVVTPSRLRGAESLPAGYGGAIVYLRRADDEKVRRIVERCQNTLRLDHYYLLVHHPLEDVGAALARPEHNPKSHMAPVSFVGGGLKTFNRSALTFFGRQIRAYGAVSLVWVIPAAVLCAPLVLASNAWLRFRQPAAARVQQPSSILFRISR